MRLTRSQLAAIDQELLDFCLIEVPKFQYNFETLEAHVLTLALERKFSRIIAVNEINFENLVSDFFQKDVHLVPIQKILENNHPIFTQDFMLLFNINKIVKELFVKKFSAKEKHHRNYLVHSLIRNSQKKKCQENFPLKSKKDIVVPVSASVSRNFRGQWLFDLKNSSLVVFKAEYDLQNKCKDNFALVVCIVKNVSFLFIISVSSKWVGLK